MSGADDPSLNKKTENPERVSNFPLDITKATGEDLARLEGFGDALIHAILELRSAGPVTLMSLCAITSKRLSFFESLVEKNHLKPIPTSTTDRTYQLLHDMAELRTAQAVAASSCLEMQTRSQQLIKDEIGTSKELYKMISWDISERGKLADSQAQTMVGHQEDLIRHQEDVARHQKTLMELKSSVCEDKETLAAVKIDLKNERLATKDMSKTIAHLTELTRGCMDKMIKLADDTNMWNSGIMDRLETLGGEKSSVESNHDQEEDQSDERQPAWKTKVEKAVPSDYIYRGSSGDRSRKSGGKVDQNSCNQPITQEGSHEVIITDSTKLQGGQTAVKEDPRKVTATPSTSTQQPEDQQALPQNVSPWQMPPGYPRNDWRVQQNPYYQDLYGVPNWMDPQMSMNPAHPGGYAGRGRGGHLYNTAGRPGGNYDPTTTPPVQQLDAMPQAPEAGAPPPPNDGQRRLPPQPRRNARLERADDHRQEEMSDNSDDSSPYSDDDEAVPRRGQAQQPLPRMETFNGSAKWSTFLFSFKFLARGNRWTARKKLEMLRTCLRDKAVAFVEKQPREVQRDYGLLSKALGKRFGTKDPPSTYRKNLQGIAQFDGESLEEFSERVYSHTADGYPAANEAMIQELAVDYFFKGCKNKNATVLANTGGTPCKTLNKACRRVKEQMQNLKTYNAKAYAKQVYAEEPEDFPVSFLRNTSPNRSRSRPSQAPRPSLIAAASQYKVPPPMATSEIPELPEVGEGEPRLAQMFKDFLDICKRAAERSPPVTPRRTASPGTPGSRSGICYYCKQPGHFKAECPTRPPTAPKSGICYYCKKPGHFQSECPHLPPYVPSPEKNTQG